MGRGFTLPHEIPGLQREPAWVLLSPVMRVMEECPSCFLYLRQSAATGACRGAARCCWTSVLRRKAGKYSEIVVPMPGVLAITTSPQL